MQLRGRVRHRWGKLTDNQLEQISGSHEQLVGLVEESYGYTREKAQEQVDGFIDSLKQNLER